VIESERPVRRRGWRDKLRGRRDSTLINR
jgi:hypothetical protein